MHEERSRRAVRSAVSRTAPSTARPGLGKNLLKNLYKPSSADYPGEKCCRAMYWGGCMWGRGTGGGVVKAGAYVTASLSNSNMAARRSYFIAYGIARNDVAYNFNFNPPTRTRTAKRLLLDVRDWSRRV
ncbi:hypothetical protein J6590_017789 [Homalodisca vitripennis]|nr:hypothetical protein J6590_017789 [Homalodisca vitripennis]